MSNTLIVITGPTAVGKTELCLEIAKKFGIPIINADSRQIYRDLKIGTAAPTEQQKKEVTHYFAGCFGLDHYYNASMYEQEVIALLDQLFSCNGKDHTQLPPETDCNKKRYALMTGGSMMYIDAVCNGIDDIPTITEDIRNEMKKRLANEGLDNLCKELERLDPEYYSIVDKKNTRRVIHGLEICIQTGQTYTSFRKKTKKERPFRTIKIALNRPREELYERINKRVDNMIKDGLADEARSLYMFKHLNALNTVGYKELFEHFDGKYNLQEAIERIKGNTRRYARKQITWFKRDKDVYWFNPDNKEEIINFISRI